MSVVVGTLAGVAIGLYVTAGSSIGDKSGAGWYKDVFLTVNLNYCSCENTL